MTRRAESTRPAPAALSGPTGSLRPSLVLLAASALLLGVAQLVLGDGAPTEAWVPLGFTLVFWCWAGAGIAAWWRRPGSLTGALLVAGALTVLVVGLGNLGSVTFGLLGAVLATASLAVTVHLLLAFPSGRVRGGMPTATVIGGYVVSLLLQAPLYLVPPEQAALIGTAVWVQRTAGVVVVVLTAVILVRRLRSADPRNLRVLLPLYLYGVLAVLLIPVSGSAIPLLGGDFVLVGAVQLVILAGIPLAFLLGMLAGGFSRTAEADALSAWLGRAGSTRSSVAQALASSLGDESLRVAYWSGDRGEFVDESGRPAPSPGAPRMREEVSVEGRRVAAIDYDGRMISDAATVRRAAGVLAIALDRERLTAALMASNEALGLSRLRLVEAADRERDRIARDLHDGLQVQLVLLALEAQQIANADEVAPGTADAVTALRGRIDDAATELRRLVHDVLPSALVERGLTAAVDDVVDRLAVPATLTSDLDDRALSASTARTAYLIVSEALSNAAKHSGAAAVAVTLNRRGDRLHLEVRDDGQGGARLDAGTGLKGLADRVDALGGRFELLSPHGGGTIVRVDLPCAS